MALDAIEYQAEGDDTTLVGRLARPAGPGPHPVVMVGHTWAGCDDFVQQQAQRLADLGYIGFALDMYGGGQVSDSIGRNKELMEGLLADRPLLRRRMQAALATARGLDGADTGRIGGMGYCFGGLCMLDLVRTGAELNGIVSFHGALHNGGMPTEKIRTSILVLHGEQDSFIPQQEIAAFVDEVNAAEADWQMHVYAYARHGFTNPKDSKPELGIDYDANADRRSWQAMRNFFEEVFAS